MKSIMKIILSSRLLLCSMSLFLVASAAFVASVVYAQDNPPSTPKAPAPKEFVDLLHVDLHGGQIVTPANFTLTKPGAKFQQGAGAFIAYEQTYSDYGSYKFLVDNPELGKTSGRREIRSDKVLDIKPNRHYILSILVKTDFDRNASEFNVYIRTTGAVTPRHTLGLPAITKGPDGWQRLEWIITTATDPRITGAKAALDFYVKHGNKPAEVRFADYTVIELPAKPLKPIPRGEGVTFPGSAGDLPMKVESHSVNGNQIVVETTGARYEFNTTDNTILASQRIEFPRDLAKWHSSLPLANLRVDKQTDDVCVLTNDQMTIGIQRDSLMVINPQHELRMTLTNLLGGDYNRYSRGYLYSTDDFGGISVDPYIPPGTGLKPQSELLTKGLSFVHLTPMDALNEEKDLGSKDPFSTEKLGSAEPGWKALWTTLPGEFFTTSVFPPKPFDWKKSFTEKSKTFHIDRADQPSNVPNKSRLTTWLLWDYIPKTFGHSYSDYYEPVDDKNFRNIVAAAHNLGIRVIPYMSAYWTPTRDPEVFIDGVKKFKEEYRIDGIYSDGLPSVDWMVAYKEMRMLRDLFPSGYISVHNSIKQSGWDVSQQMPFLYSYATQVSMTEGVPSYSGLDWQYPRYFTSQFRKSNSFGKTYGFNWYFPNGEKVDKAGNLVTLVYNGRDARLANPEYFKILNQLEKLWEEKGDQPFFYDRYYLPSSQKLTGMKMGRTGMPIVKSQTTNGRTKITLESLSADAMIHYTTDGSRPDKNSKHYDGPIIIEGNAQVKAVAMAPGLDPSAVASIKSK